MTIPAIDEAQRAAAKVAGIVWPISFAIVVAANFGVFARLVSEDDPLENAQNILAHETLFRIGVAGDVLYCVGVVVVGCSLYVVLKPVSGGIALLAAVGRLIHGLTWLMVAVNLFSALRLLTELADAHAAESGQLFALVRLYLTSADAYYVGLLFWSLGTAAASYLWLQSNYIPRLLAICGLASSGWCAMCTLYYYIDPNVSEAGLWWFDSPLGIFELALSFWLVFKGLGAHGVAEVQPASGTT